MSTEVNVMIKKMPHAQDLSLPVYMSEFAAGLDLCAAVADDVMLEPGKYKLIPTGIAIALPVGYEGQVRPRSGLAIKHGLTLLNAPGTIDADYRGEIKVILINHGETVYYLKRGDRVAQLVIQSVARANLTEVDNLPETLRGEGGFGHTG